MSTLNDPHSMGPNVGQNRSRPGSNMSPNRFTRNMNSGPSSIIHEGDEFGDYRESHPGMLSTGNGSGSGVTVDSWSHSRSETPTNFQSTPTNPKQSRAFSPSPNETKPAVCNRCTIYKEEIAQLQMSLNDTLAALNIDATRSALNTATPGPRASSPGVILTPPPTHSILPLKPKEPKASDLLSDENSMSFVELEKEIQHEKVVESSDNKASSTEAKTMPSSDRGDNIAENLANTDNTGSLVLASEDKNSIKGVAGTVQASNEQEFLGSDTTLAFAKVSVTAEGSLHTENEEKTVAAVEASQKPIQKDDLESKAVKESDISENPLTVDTKKYVSIEVESKVPQDTVSKQEISSKDATAAVDGNPGPVLESLTENRISPQRVVSPTNIDRVSAATATMHLQKERSPSHSPAIQVHSDKAAESSTTTPSSLPNSRDGKCSVSPPAAHSAVSQFIAQQRSESLKYQQMHQATLSRGTAAGTEPATVPAADQSTSSVKEQSPSTATVNEAVPSLSLGSSQGTTLNQVDFKGFSDDSPGNSRGCSRQQLELEAKKNESKQCIAIPVSSNSGALNEVYQSNTKIFTSINGSNSNAGSVQSEHSIMVPSQAQSSVHSSNNPLMLVDSSAIAMLSKQKEENTMLIKLLHESSSVQAELQNVVASLQKQNTDLLAKIKEDEDVMATNSNLYRLQLKERGLLLRELSNEVNNLRSEIARTKSINNRSRITVPLKSSISDIKNQASSNIMTKQSIELNSADMLYSDPSVNETKQPPSVIPHHDALVAKHKQALDQIPGRPFSQGNELIWTPDAGAVPIATSASCSQLNPSKVLQNKTGKTLFEASGGAFGRIDLRKQQEELEFQESLLRMPWHDRMNAIKERQAREEELEVKKLYSTRAKSPPTKNKKINRNRKSTENLDNSEAEADGNISNSDANRLYNSSAGLDATYGGNSELVQNCSALILPELPEAKRIELKAIRDQIAIIMAEKIGPKVSFLALY